MNRSTNLIAALLTLTATGAQAAAPIQARLYKNPQCGCCDEYARVLEQNGFDVTLENTADMQAVKQQSGVPAELEGCHTMLVDGYVVEGLVPVATLTRLLTERPEIKGISLPGMPVGAPGMPGPKAEPFKIYVISDGAPEVYSVE